LLLRVEKYRLGEIPEGKEAFNAIDEIFWIVDYSTGYGKYEIDDVLPEIRGY
jgi:hypothetical protein